MVGLEWIRLKYMKKLIVPFLLLSVLLVSPVKAEEIEDKGEGLMPRKVMLQDRVKAVKTKRVETKEMMMEKRQEMEGKREEYKAKWQGIKDDKKKALLEKIDDRLNEFNQKASTSMSKVLARLSGIVEKLADKTDVTKAQTSIAEAQVAVDAQAAKEYVIEFEDETGLRVGASSAKESLRADLKVVRGLVGEARELVKMALEAAKASSEE